ncbi:MAG TPA: hypothetical protein VFL83_10005 [Anaeromyxobacter sp.]|nr:hypothetical protein [Anaeromyxobacter sp.]
MATLATARQPLLERVSWGALFAGFFFGFGIWMLLLALGAGIGFSAFDPRDLQHWQGLGIGFGIWGVIAGIVAMFLAAWLAARLSRSDTRLAGMLHGAALWGFMLVAGLWIATMALAGTASKAADVAGGAMQGAGQAAGQAANDPQARREARQQANEAEQRAQALAQQAQQKAPEAAETAKKAGATGAWAFFLYGLLTLAAAIFGGRTGVPRETHVVGREERVPPPGEPLPHRV